jgi:hypothetical protein
MKTTFRCVLGLCASLAMAAHTDAAEYVVSPDGDDAATGRATAPWRTLGHAASVMQPGDRCLLRGGIYREAVKLQDKSATAEQPLSFAAWPGETPIFSGCDLVEGWERVRGDLWKAHCDWSLGEFSQLFINGQPGFEARWPNKNNDDPLDWEGQPFKACKQDDVLHCPELPERPDDYWRGAVLWVMGGAKWTSWSVVVENYDAAAKALSFPNAGKNTRGGWRFMGLTRPQGGYFYLTGGLEEVDAPGEWFYDEATQTLYLQLPAGLDANTQRIEFQRRRQALTLQRCRHLHISGLQVLGATVQVSASEDCLLASFRILHQGHYRGGNSSYGLGVQVGSLINGSRNILRDSEIAYCAGNGVSVSGTRNSVINCWIHHTDYTGSYDTPIRLAGEEHLVSHCSLHDTGRDCMLPGGQAHIIQYNDIYHMGRICHDLGATYVCASDGGGTEFRYNWCHDNVAKGTRMGIYLDNFTSNYFVYRNVVWNINGCDIRLNRPGQNNHVINNSMLGKAGNWGRWGSDWLYHCSYINNAVVGSIASHHNAIFVGNGQNIASTALNIENFMNFHADQGAGLLVPGITGDNPGIGAYEPGDSWRAGHDFEHPPNPEYRLADTPLRNLIQHGSFQWSRYHGKLGPWQPTGSKSAKIIWGGGGITESYSTRDSIVGAGLELAGAETSGVEQDLPPLRPEQHYEYICWVKLVDGAALSIALYEDGERVAEAAESRADGEWRQLFLRYLSSATPGAHRVAISQRSGGKAFVDDVSFAGIVAGMEPRLPGQVPVAPPAPKRPPLPRRTSALLVPSLGTGYPAQAELVQESPDRSQAEGLPARAWLAHGEGTLRVKIEVPLAKAPLRDGPGQWTKTDGVELCFADADNNAQHPTFILHGFPDGSHESSLEAGAPEAASAALARATSFQARIHEGGWTAEWTVPLAAAGIATAPGTELRFNIGIFRREARQWLQWAGTNGQTWLVDQAVVIRLE